MLFCWSGDHTLRITGLDGLWGSSWLSGSLELYHTVPTDEDACLIYPPARKTLIYLCSQLWSPCMKHTCFVLEGLLASEPIRGSSTCEPITPAHQLLWIDLQNSSSPYSLEGLMLKLKHQYSHSIMSWKVRFTDNHCLTLSPLVALLRGKVMPWKEP